MLVTQLTQAGRKSESDSRFPPFPDFSGKRGSQGRWSPDSPVSFGTRAGNRESPFPDSAANGNRGPGGARRADFLVCPQVTQTVEAPRSLRRLGSGWPRSGSGSCRLPVPDPLAIRIIVDQGPNFKLPVSLSLGTPKSPSRTFNLKFLCAGGRKCVLYPREQPLVLQWRAPNRVVGVVILQEFRQHGSARRVVAPRVDLWLVSACHFIHRGLHANL